MFKIGLTGGIGSGKTTVANLFAELGVPIIDTDQIARAVVAPHSAGWQKVVEHFAATTDLLDPKTQEINRSQLREIIFNHPKEKQWLENLLHPLIRAEVQRQEQLLTAAYCIIVIPLLIENQHDYQLDRILLVDALPEMQINRATARDAVTAAHVQQIMASQASRAQRLAQADDVIENSDINLAELRQRVLALHYYYLQLGQ